MPPVTIEADPGRPYIRVPILVLGVVVIVAAMVPLVVWAVHGTHALHAVVPASTQTFIIGSLVLYYIRIVYSGRTRLNLDAVGVTLEQPFASWTVRWAEITGLTVTSPWDLTHKGGVAAGVRLAVTLGRARHIPDVLRLKRGDVAALIEAHRKGSAPL